MKCFFQLLSKDSGTRSPAFGCERTEAAAVLLRWCIENGPDSGDGHYVIVLTDDIKDGEWNFSQAPLLTVRNFIEQFGA